MYRLKTVLILIYTLLFIANQSQAQKGSKDLSLKEAFAGKFDIGAAINLKQIYGRDEKATALIASQFNSITAENCMKAMYLQPIEGEFNFRDADRFVELGAIYGLRLTGPTWIWHSKASHWFLIGTAG